MRLETWKAMTSYVGLAANTSQRRKRARAPPWGCGFVSFRCADNLRPTTECLHKRLQESTGSQALMLFFRCAPSVLAGPGSISNPLTSTLRTSHHQVVMLAVQLPFSEISGARNLILGTGPHDVFTDCLDSESKGRQLVPLRRTPQR